MFQHLHLDYCIVIVLLSLFSILYCVCVFGGGGGRGRGHLILSYFFFAERKQQGIDKKRRISADALRTLESIYERTPFPSFDVVK